MDDALDEHIGMVHDHAHARWMRVASRDPATTGIWTFAYGMTLLVAGLLKMASPLAWWALTTCCFVSTCMAWLEHEEHRRVLRFLALVEAIQRSRYKLDLTPITYRDGHLRMCRLGTMLLTGICLVWLLLAIQQTWFT